MSTAPLTEKLSVTDTAFSLERSQSKRMGLAAALTFLGAYFQLFLFPATPVAPWGDPVVFLENAKRILAGQLPYTDYLQFTTPGTELFYALLMRIWHARAWIPNLTMATLAALTALLMTYIATRLFSGLVSLVPALLLAGFVLPNSLYATHHWFSTVALLAATCVLIDRTTVYRVAIAGLFCGIAGFFTQTKMLAGVIALTFFFLAEARQGGWRQLRIRLGELWLSAGVVFVLANSYFIRAVGFGRFVFCTIVFPIRYYPAETYNTWRVYGAAFSSHPGHGRLIGIIFVHLLLPLIYLVWFFYRRKHPTIDPEIRRKEVLVALVGVAMFFAVAGAPSILRLCTASPPALILFVRVFEEKPGRYFLYAATALATLLIFAIPIGTQEQWHAVLDTPSGRIAFLDADRFEEFRWVLERTRAGQAFFGHPALSFDLGLRNPTPVNLATTSDFTRPEEVTEIVESLEQSNPPLLVLIPTEYVAAEGGSRSDHMEPFREYLLVHYQLARRFASGDEGWVVREAKIR